MYHTAKEYTPHSGAPRHRPPHTGQAHHGAIRYRSIHIPKLAGLTAKVVEPVDALNIHERISQVLKEDGIAVNQPDDFPFGDSGVCGANFEVFRSEVFHIP